MSMLVSVSPSPEPAHFPCHCYWDTAHRTARTAWHRKMIADKLHWNVLTNIKRVWAVSWICAEVEIFFNLTMLAQHIVYLILYTDTMYFVLIVNTCDMRCYSRCILCHMNKSLVIFEIYFVVQAKFVIEVYHSEQIYFIYKHIPYYLNVLHK